MSTISRKTNYSIHNMTKSRPVLTADLNDQALSSASLTDEEEELIEFVRYTGVIDELILRKGLCLPAKPPALCRLSNICDKIGEPPFMLGFSAFFALSHAATFSGENYPDLSTPATHERLFWACERVEHGD